MEEWFFSMIFSHLAENHAKKSLLHRQTWSFSLERMNSTEIIIFNVSLFIAKSHEVKTKVKSLSTNIGKPTVQHSAEKLLLGDCVCIGVDSLEFRPVATLSCLNVGGITLQFFENFDPHFILLCPPPTHYEFSKKFHPFHFISTPSLYAKWIPFSLLLKGFYDWKQYENISLHSQVKMLTKNVKSTSFSSSIPMVYKTHK